MTSARGVRAALSAAVLGTAAAAGSAPPVAPVKPVTETLWGQPVTDNYRYMEALGPSTLAWMRAQGEFARSVLDSIKPRAQLESRIAAFSASIGLVDGYMKFGGRAFYQQRAPGQQNFDLLETDASGTRKIVDVSALRAMAHGQSLAINYFLASPDGSKVAVGISAGGSEEAQLSVYDAASGARIAGPIDRADYGATSWSDDSKVLYFLRLKPLAADAPATERYRDVTAYAWDLTGPPAAILGSTVGHGPAFSADETPAIELAFGAPLAAAMSMNGVQNELAMWLTPAASVRDPATRWTPFISRDDDVTSVDMRGSEIFILSHKDAPTFKVLAVTAGENLASAETLVPAQPDRVIDAINAAADGLYVLARRGAYSQLLRVATGTHAIEEIPLPFAGHIDDAFADPRAAGVTITLSSWTVPTTLFAYDPATRSFTDLKLGTPGGAAGSNDDVVSDLQAKAGDGTLVPLSLVESRSGGGTGIAMIEAYGSYGISELADFSVRRAAAVREGIAYGICHVRGGGEFGEAWRLAGKDANKHNTWQDLIACGEFLIARGTTTKQKLFIVGGSAGGIAVGRAMSERPDLFAGVIDMVPASNTLRSEFSPNGPPNIPEFGTVTTPDGFRNLAEMDTVAHIRKGTQYPAILISTGLNDPRVPPWEPAKLAATLQASGTKNPVLLRIEADSGHGIGSTKEQTDALTADGIAFVLWRAGLPQWQPQRSKR